MDVLSPLKLGKVPQDSTEVARKNDLPVKATAVPQPVAYGGTAAVGSSAKYAAENHVHAGPAAVDISGKQDKIEAGSTAGHALLDTTTLGSVSKTTGTLAIQTSLAVGNTTQTGGVTIRSAGTSATTIIGPNNATTTLVSGTMAKTASPAFTGTPTAPTAAVGTNTTQLATTAFVQAALPSGSIGKISTTSAKPSGTNVTVGSYKVGASKIFLSWAGLICLRGEQFDEVGTNGATSTTVTLLFDVEKDDSLWYIILG
jgi:hypothetical protein